MTADKPLLVADSLVAGYVPEVNILNGCSLELFDREMVGIIGPNGAGKSTLLDAVTALLRPASGRLEVLGTAPERARDRVAYVLQSAKVADRLPITVHEVVTMARYARAGLVRRLRPSDRDAVASAMARVGITDLAGRHVTELSGGQRQRVFVAQGLAQEAELLVLDEPVTGLDLLSRRVILDVVADEVRGGRTVVMTTHDLGEAAGADHVLLLSGRVLASGPPGEVLTSRHLSAAYGGRLLRLDDGRVMLDDAAHTHSHAHEHEHPADAHGPLGGHGH